MCPQHPGRLFLQLGFGEGRGRGREGEEETLPSPGSSCQDHPGTSCASPFPRFPVPPQPVSGLPWSPVLPRENNSSAQLEGVGTAFRSDSDIRLGISQDPSAARKRMRYWVPGFQSVSTSKRDLRSVSHLLTSIQSRLTICVLLETEVYSRTTMSP